jgi:hypothetical protein
MRTVVSNEGVEQLVARARNGDQVAWDRLVERYGRMVWAVACAHGLGPADAGDVSQITWLLLTQHLGSLAQPERLGSGCVRPPRARRFECVGYATSPRLDARRGRWRMSRTDAEVSRQ